MADDTRLNADGAEEGGGAPHKEADEALERYKLHSSEGERLLAKEYSSSAIASFIQAAGFIGSIKEVQVRRQCECTLFCNLGKGYADIFEKAKSVECFNHAIKVAQEIGDEDAERRAHVAKGEAYADFATGNS
jgi:hypothetical protein